MSAIPGLDDRELILTLLSIVLSIVGAWANYLYHKKTTDAMKTVTVKSLFVKAVIGVTAGILSLGALAIANNGLDTIYHWQVMISAVGWGIGSESIVGKYLGSREKDKAIQSIMKTEEEKPDG